MRSPALVAACAALGLAAATPGVAPVGAAAHVAEGCYVAVENDPDVTEDDVIACEEQHYFHKATTLVSNAGYVAEPHGIATFDTTPPAGSVTGGNGGGYAAWSTLLVGGDDDLVDATFEGTFTGTVDRLDVDLHILVDSFTRLGTEQTLDIEVEVDGAPLASFGEVAITPVAEESSQAGSVRLDFAVTGLAELLQTFGLPNAADTEHTVQLKVGAFFLNQVTVFAFDTTEVPGGIGFNRVDVPEGTVVLEVG